MKPETTWKEVESQIQNAEQLGGAVGATVISAEGSVFSYQGDRQFGAASTVKIPLMIELFRQIDRGDRTLDDTYVLQDSDRAVGSGVMLHLHQGMVFTLDDLIYLMISISDNTATNVLIDLAGMDNVNATMQSLGMKQSNLGRKMKGRPAQGDEQENWATSNDYANVVKTLLDGTAASSESCKQMLTKLEQQQGRRRIGRYVPEEEDIRFGAKPGSVQGVTNEVGFISSPSGTLIISVFCENLPDQHTGEKVIGDISRAAMTVTGVATPLQTS